MGFSISWLAFEGATRSDVLAATGMRDTGVVDEVNEAPFSCAEIPTGWTVLYSNNYLYAPSRHLKRLSRNRRILACISEEHVMFSAASLYVNGDEAWAVYHYPQSGLFDLSVSGNPPAQFVDIRDRQIEKQRQAGGETSMVDHVFDIPIALAADICGYRYDRCRFDWGKPAFTVAERSLTGRI